MSRPFFCKTFVSTAAVLLALSGCDSLGVDPALVPSPELAPPSPLAVQDELLSDPAAEYVAPLCAPVDTARAEEVLAQINTERKARMMRPLKLSENLNFAAQAHACDMVSMGQLQVAGSNGSSIVERVRAVEYLSCASAQLTGKAPDGYLQVAKWLGNKPDQEIVINKKFDEAGVGVVQAGGTLWWSLVVADKCGFGSK